MRKFDIQTGRFIVEMCSSIKSIEVRNKFFRNEDEQFKKKKKIISHDSIYINNYCPIITFVFIHFRLINKYSFKNYQMLEYLTL